MDKVSALLGLALWSVSLGQITDLPQARVHRLLQRLWIVLAQPRRGISGRRKLRGETDDAPDLRVEDRRFDSGDADVEAE